MKNINSLEIELGNFALLIKITFSIIYQNDNPRSPIIKAGGISGVKNMQVKKQLEVLLSRDAISKLDPSHNIFAQAQVS